MSELPIATVNDTRWLDETQQSAWRSFLGGTTVLMDRLDRDLRTEHGLSMSEYEILVRLSEAPDRSIRMADLAAALSHSRSRITHTISRLERDGIVLRTQCGTDGRGVTAVLTDKGFALLATAAHTHVRGVREYLIDQCSDEDLAATKRVMDAIQDAIGGRVF
ncbi:MarR family winged helix-turn-helix transcriptional regulator [Aeromicrobium choanae]|uniref:Transcriptional regulator, MarR family n=1 Tax=Aeromicrobium choanae TaxID=1736691 RepID=A0A1T4Z2Y5_9ACTN|nr:MarR family transcriptional regulator [Aeromicrobium choanae]SKB08417.1 transcriptional regulator, MarR family [Aeromicrobium choanae]